MTNDMQSMLDLMAAAEAKASSRRGRSVTVTTEPVAVEAVAPEPVTDEPKTQEPEAQEPEAQESETQEPKTQEPEAQEPAGGLAISHLPALDAAPVQSDEPRIAYKTAWGNGTNWICSTDGGKTNTDSGVSAVAGCPVDIHLEAMKDAVRDQFYLRLRLAFIDSEGLLCELNLNTLNQRKSSNESYVVAPVRALMGALLMTTRTAQGCQALCAGSRFRLVRGRAASFIEVDIARDDQWVQTGRGSWAMSPEEPLELIDAVALVRERLEAQGMPIGAQTILGDKQGLYQFLGVSDAVDTEAVEG